MVRLKVVKTKIMETCYSWFQFLYGAIKRICMSAKIAVTCTFQFLYGAIKSEVRWACAWI